MAAIKTILGVGTAGALMGAMGTSASAQHIYYEDGDYLYAAPAPVAAQNDVVTQPLETGVPVTPTAQRTIPMRSRPVVQQTPPQSQPQIVMPAPSAYPQGYPAPQYTTYYTAPGYPAQSYTYASQNYAAYPTAARSIPQTYNGGAQNYLPNGAQLVQFDRQAWLDECNSRIGQYDESDRGKVIGALLGAAAGGLIGNRIADGERLGGTLIGAGTGAIAGSVVGDAIDDRNDRRRGYDRDYCAAYLDDYMARASQAGPATTFVPGQQYMLVPITVPVAQQAVYREYVAPPR